MNKAEYIVDRLLEAGPDDLDPKTEFLNTEPDAVPWLLDTGFAPFHPGSKDTFRKTYTHGWAVVHVTGVSATPYELTVNFRSGGRRYYPDLDFGELRRVLEHHFIAEAFDPDNLDPKHEFMRVDPAMEHWLERNGFTCKFNDGFYHKEVSGVHYNVRKPVWGDEITDTNGWMLSVSATQKQYLRPPSEPVYNLTADEIKKMLVDYGVAEP